MGLLPQLRARTLTLIRTPVPRASARFVVEGLTQNYGHLYGRTMRTTMKQGRTVRTITLVTILLLIVQASLLKGEEKVWASYYPLARGNSWAYVITGETGRITNNVVWRVLLISANSAKMIIENLSERFQIKAGKRLRILCDNAVTPTPSTFDRQLKICREEYRRRQPTKAESAVIEAAKNFSSA